MRLLLLAAFVLLFTATSYSQNTDSLIRAIDSSSKIIQQKYEDLEDSIYQARMNRPVHERGEVLDDYLASYKEREQEERKQSFFRIGLGIVFLAVLAYGIIRRRKRHAIKSGN